MFIYSLKHDLGHGLKQLLTSIVGDRVPFHNRNIFQNFESLISITDYSWGWRLKG